MMVSPDFLTQFEAERDALRATNRQLAEANATLTAELAALAARITEFERLQQVWLMSPEAAQRLQGYRDLAGKCAELTVELAEARALNAQLAAQVDDARRQRDECAAALATIGHQMEAQQILDATAPATNDDARAILHAMASEPARPHVAVVVERASIALCLPFPLRIRLPDRHEIAVTTDEAAAVVTALLADGAVHERWLHGRGGK